MLEELELPMCFVNNEIVKLPLLVQHQHHLFEMILSGQFGSNIQQLDLWRIASQIGNDLFSQLRRYFRVQCGRIDLSLFQLLNLIVNESDERRDDNGEAVVHHGGQLKAKRLSRTRRHRHIAIVLTFGDFDARLTLQVGLEFIVAKVFLQTLLQSCFIIFRRRRSRRRFVVIGFI